MKVAIIAASTLCGRISPAGMGSAVDRRHLEAARDRTDASLIGATTLRAEDPEMRGSGGALSAQRIRAVVTAAGKVPVVGKKLFQSGPRPLVFTGTRRAPSLTAKLGAAAEVVGVTETAAGVSLVEVVSGLARRGVASLLIEGGGSLNYAALAQGIVDEVYLTLTPTLSGARPAATLADGSGPLGRPFLSLDLLSCRQEPATGELFLHYRVKRRP